MVFGYHTGQHSKMPVMLAPSICTAAAKSLARVTVNVEQLESAAQGCVNVKVDV